MKNKTTGDSEKYLIKLLVSGDKKAFEEVYLKYKNGLYQFVKHLIGRPEDAEDLVQEVFIKIWENRRIICPEMSFTAYLFTIARNKIISHVRRLQIEQKIINQWLIEYSRIEESTQSEIVSKEYESFLRKKIDSLPPRRRLVFQLSREEKMSHGEIAKQLGISVYTVQEHISESLVYFKSSLLKHPDIRSIISRKI
ncbi:DNA-directed RNA polymerase sigma-70 factor [Bacteroidia bacterium]|nr:DNA-directed RNA polymerase sigma-70 factor [Bacteroidia bacterium]GHV19781.1 DNA-directed RNA polymerase sigma-70 factor [Bacteroidia bacterium]